MSEYLLLKDKRICPVCRCKGRVNHFTQCMNCGTMLFLRPIQFTQWEADGGIPNWWMFTQDLGWMHRDHVMNGHQALKRTHYNVKIAERNTKSVISHEI